MAPCDSNPGRPAIVALQIAAVGNGQTKIRNDSIVFIFQLTILHKCLLNQDNACLYCKVTVYKSYPTGGDRAAPYENHLTCVALVTKRRAGLRAGHRAFGLKSSTRLAKGAIGVVADIAFQTQTSVAKFC